ncbi:hypothetical protein LXL04_037008 [Taraxacum kok-saghyz]
MRGIELPLNQTQKIRLQRALELLDSLSSGTNSNASVTVADSIPVNQEDGVLKGHGTTELEGEVVATVCGVIERVNKLVYVRTLRARYKPEVGDIIVGRVLEVAPKRWRLEINFSQDAVLMLSSMNLPDGIQRRRTAVDELNMRTIFEENDVICAEVRDFMRDGSLQLQARSQKYGKLERGQMLTISPYLVKRRKQHFHHLEQYNIDLILGCNGFIWVGEHVETKDNNMVEDDPIKPIKPQIPIGLEEQEETYTPLETRQNICKIANAIRVLSTFGFSITVDVIQEVVDLGNSKGVDIHEMLGAEFCVLVAEREAERRSRNIRYPTHSHSRSGKKIQPAAPPCSTAHWRFPAIGTDARFFVYAVSMKIIGCNCIPKSSILIAHHEISSLTFCNPLKTTTSALLISNHQHKRPNFITKLQCSVASRPYSSNSTNSSTSKSDSVRMNRKQGGSSSIYSRTSLLEMKNERIANRARVYDFLKGIGIEPDELDGLELPVTVDVMKERVDFLHTLGLTIEDINNYPLVLGCSVKKNMIPVLDYLGKLGVKRSTLTDFLQRYPQVLHASVVVDLAPVVKYLEGMDIKPNDIPRVLEKYPEVLGYKLEGTMSTSVAYLVGIGVARREIGSVLTRYPEILGMRVGRVIKPFVDYLESLGIPTLAIARLIETRPHILGFGLEHKVKPNVKLLKQFSVREGSISSVIAQYPEIIGLDLESRLSKQQTFLNSIIDFTQEDFGKIIEKMPQIVSLSNPAVIKHVDFLKTCGFSLDQVKKMVVGCPQLLALNMDIMKLNFDYFESKMGRELDELVEFPAFFTYGLESTIKPRHRVVAKKGLKCSLAWLLNCSNAKFEERMNYDTIDMEEMGDDSGFDMNSLMEPRNDGSDSEFDEDSDEEYL